MSARRGSGRWVVPYADLVTLLFALFAMLYAMSALDRERLAGVADGLRSAFGSGSAGPLVVPTSRKASPPPLHPRAAGEQLERLSRELTRTLGDQAAVSLEASGLHVLHSGPSFGGGSALSPGARGLLAAAAGALRGYPGPVHVVARAPDWPLATARAAAATRELVASALPSAQLAAVARTGGEAEEGTLALWLPHAFASPEPAIGESETLRRLLDQLPPPAEGLEPPVPQAADSPSGAGSGSGSRVE